MDIKEENKGHFDTLTHDLLPACVVVFIAWETVYQVLMRIPASLLHGGLDQVNGDGDGHDFSFLDDVINQLAVLRARVTLQSCN